MLNVKQVIVVRRDLNMRRGKQIAQGAHASMKVLLDLMEWDYYSAGKTATLMLNGESPLLEWLEGSFSKICVYVESEEELESLYQQAKDAGMLCSLIIDNGATEFHGVKTKTVCAIGPDYADKIDKITGHLKLL